MEPGVCGGGGPRSGQENGRTPVVTPPAGKQRRSETQKHTLAVASDKPSERELSGRILSTPHCCQSDTVRFNKDHYVFLGVEHNILGIYHGTLLFVIYMQMFYSFFGYFVLLFCFQRERSK